MKKLLKILRNGEVLKKTDLDKLEKKDFEFNRNFGIEIEGFSLLTRKDIAEIVQAEGLACAAVPWNSSTRVFDSWAITTDGSIKDLPRGMPESKGYEINSPILVGEEGLRDLRVLLDVIRNPKKMRGNIFRTNKTCAVHVHIDRSGISLDKLEIILQVYRHYEDEINLIFPMSRIEPSGKDFSKDLKRVSLEKVMGGYKYVSVRVTDGTLEFRKHGATTNYEKIYRWIQIISLLIDTSLVLEVDCFSDLPYLRDLIQDPELLNYYNSRVKKFARKLADIR